MGAKTDKLKWDGAGDVDCMHPKQWIQIAGYWFP